MVWVLKGTEEFSRCFRMRIRFQKVFAKACRSKNPCTLWGRTDGPMGKEGWIHTAKLTNKEE